MIRRSQPNASTVRPVHVQIVKNSFFDGGKVGAIPRGKSANQGTANESPAPVGSLVQSRGRQVERRNRLHEKDGSTFTFLMITVWGPGSRSFFPAESHLFPRLILPTESLITKRLTRLIN